MESCSAYYKPLYSLSVEDKSHYIYSCDLCISVNFGYILTYPCLDLLVSGSSVSFGSHLPEKLHPLIPIDINPWLATIWLLCLMYHLGTWLTTLLVCHIHYQGILKNYRTGELCMGCNLYLPFLYHLVYQQLICSQMIFQILVNNCVVLRIGSLMWVFISAPHFTAFWDLTIFGQSVEVAWGDLIHISCYRYWFLINH